MSKQDGIPDRDRKLTGTPPTGQAGRPRELQDTLNFHLYHPLAWRLARALARTPVTPNMVSVIGALFVMGAAAAYVLLAWPLSVAIGLLLHMTWHVVDGADGDLARLTGRTSAAGELIDGVCDYAGHIVLYLALGFVLQMEIGWFAWVLAVAAGASRIAQSNHFEVQRRQYQWWIYGVAWLRHAKAEDLDGTGRFAIFRPGYLALAQRMAPHAWSIDTAVAEAAGDPIRLERIRLAVRRQFLGSLASLNILNANQRTIVLGLSMLAGSPLYYFLYETIFLNIALVRSVKMQEAAALRTSLEINRAAQAHPGKSSGFQLQRSAS